MSENPSEGVLPASAPPRRRGRRFIVSIVVLVGLFAVLLVERNTIRAWWWAWRLERTTDIAEQGQYIAALCSVGPAAAGAVRYLSHHESPDVRMLSIFAVQRLPMGKAAPILKELIGDGDVDVREAAGMAMCAMHQGVLIFDLIRFTEDPRPEVAASATAACARSGSFNALDGVCRAAQFHPSSYVRAQAVECLGDWLASWQGEMSDEPLPKSKSCDSVAVLTGALADAGEFSGLLSLERSAFKAEQFAGLRGGMPASQRAAPSTRRVSDVAAEWMKRLSGLPSATTPPLTSAPQTVVDEYRRQIQGRRAGEPTTTEARDSPP